MLHNLILKEILNERVNSSRGRRQVRGVKRNQTSYSVRRGRPKSQPIIVWLCYVSSCTLARKCYDTVDNQHAMTEATIRERPHLRKEAPTMHKYNRSTSF